MNTKNTLRTVLLALLCVPASGVGIRSMRGRHKGVQIVILDVYEP